MESEDRREVKLYEFVEKQKLSAGRAGKKEIFFDCGECEAKAPEVAGFLGYGPTYEEICVITKEKKSYPAFLCRGCFDKYLKKIP